MMCPGAAEAVAAETPAEAPAGWVKKQSGVRQEHGFAISYHLFVCNGGMNLKMCESRQRRSYYR